MQLVDWCAERKRAFVRSIRESWVSAVWTRVDGCPWRMKKRIRTGSRILVPAAPASESEEL